MNRCIFTGNLTKDPEMQTTSSGLSVCRFNIAVNRSYTDANGDRGTDFINVIAWRGLAENCGKYLTKGSKVCVCGSMQNRSYEDKEGNKRQLTEIIAQDVEFLSVKKADEDKPKNKSKEELKPIEDGDLLF